MRRKERAKRKIIKDLDKLFSKIVRVRGNCERCGSTKNLQCSHIFSRMKMSTRWHASNALCLCMKDHLYWWHKEPMEASTWVINKMGEENYFALRLLANTVKQWSTPELLYLEQRMKEILNNGGKE